MPMEMGKKRIVGIGCSILGFILIVLNAVDYLGGFSIVPNGSAVIGIVLVAIGMYVAKERK